MIIPFTPKQVARLESKQYWRLGRRYSSPDMHCEAIRLVRYFLQSRRQAGISVNELVELLDAPDTPDNTAWIQSVFARLEAEGSVLVDNCLAGRQRAFWVSVDADAREPGSVK